MRIQVLRVGVVTLLVMVQVAVCFAAPAPPRLEELPSIKVKAGWSDAKNKAVLVLPHSMNAICFSPDSKTLFASLRHRGVWIFEVGSRICIDEFKPDGIGFGINSISFTALSPNGKTVACVSGSSIILWDVERRKQLAVLQEKGLLHHLAFSSDGKELSTYIYSRGLIDRLRIWDVEKRQLVRTFKGDRFGMYSQVEADCGVKTPLLIDGYNRAAGDPEDKVGFRLVDAFTGQIVGKYEWDKKDGPGGGTVAMNRAETIIATAGIHVPVQLWDRKSGRPIARFPRCPGICYHLQFSPEGNILACTYNERDKRKGNDGFMLYEVPSGKVLADVKQPGVIQAWAFSPDGRLLAVEHDMEIRLWRIPEPWRRRR